MNLPDSVRDLCFLSFCCLNEAERKVIRMGEESYRELLDLYNDDAECWKVPSGDDGFHGWNPQCIPSIEYIIWKLEREKDIRERGTIPDFEEFGKREKSRLF